MNKSLIIIGMLLGASLFFNVAMNFMGDNIEDFENLPLPPKKYQPLATHNPTFQVEARSRDHWTLVDFSTGKKWRINDLEKDQALLQKWDWDLAFQRTKILTNSGVTNPKGGVGVVDLGAVDFDAIHSLPASGFKQDTREWGSAANPALSSWYLYRTRTHNIESKKKVYVVRTADGGHMKMRILNYYCGRPESVCKTGACTREEAACLTIEYQYLSPDQTRFPATQVGLTPSRQAAAP
ncbi:MAG: HmuY family protein [Nitrospinaceae bacterium]